MGTIHVTLEQVNPAQQERWREVMDNFGVAEASMDSVDPDILVLYLDESAVAGGLYYFLAITPYGRIAEFNTNQPHYYPTLAALRADHA